MASSYSNIEACLVQPVNEKTADSHDVKEDAASKYHLGPWHLIQLVLHVVSFATIIWLVVQVLNLQNELVQLNTVNLRQSGMMSANSSDPSMNYTKPRASDGGSRIRRQIHSLDSLSSSTYDSDCCDGCIGCDGFPSFHVTGVEQAEMASGNWFTFHTSMDSEYWKYSHENLKFVHNKFFEVLTPGYYYVYSQICYKVDGPHTYGHDVTVLPNCGNGDSFTILRVKSTPTALELEPEITGYAGGVFYLDANDRLGVRPLPGQTVTLDYQDSIASTSYFGAFLLAPNRHVDVNLDMNPCT